MAEISFLGTGSAVPSVDRDNTSILFTVDDINILVDVSGNPSRKIKEMNKSLDEIDYILLTHFHIDHIYGLPALLWGMWLENRSRPLTILINEENEQDLESWFQTIKLAELDINFTITIQTFNGDTSSEVISRDNFQVRTFPAKHAVPTVGCEINFNDKTIVYSADTKINSLINEYESIDVLIHEATSAREVVDYHSSMEGVLTAYELDKIKQVIFVHLTDDEPYEEILNEWDGKTATKIKIANDLMKVKI